MAPSWRETKTPRATPESGSEPVGATLVSMRFAVDGESTRVALPDEASAISRANRARSLGVVHRPAAAISGYTWRLPAMGAPSPLYPAAADGTLPGGSGCSYVL